MANTIWKEVFLIMCSSSKENARNTERFSLSLRITDDYALQTLCGEQHNICNEEGKFNGMTPNRAIYSEPQEVEMSYGELTSRFREAERNGGEHLTGYIVFTEDSFTKPYPEAARTYAVSSNNKAFQPNMGGYSIYASALDGSDSMIRLEGYMQSEKGGKDGWKIERCYMKSDEKEMIDVIFGPFFICDCSGPNYGSLNQEQIDRFMKQFENPERLIRMNGTLMSVPYKPEPDLSR